MLGRRIGRAGLPYQLTKGLAFRSSRVQRLTLSPGRVSGSFRRQSLTPDRRKPTIFVAVMIAGVFRSVNASLHNVAGAKADDAVEPREDEVAFDWHDRTQYDAEGMSPAEPCSSDRNSRRRGDAVN